MYRYSGAGNTFVVLDGRGRDVSDYRRKETVTALCSRNGTDGLMILLESRRWDFRMEFFNPDGSCGMMCGNGGRCITAFAAQLGIVPTNGRKYVFEAPDGVHSAEILPDAGTVRTVRLKMKEPSTPREVPGGWFIDTGARHYVRMVEDVEEVDIMEEGRRYRFLPEFAPEGVNVDFVQKLSDGSIKLRTFEKGVEGETLACGTGAVASAVVMSMKDGNSYDPFRMTVRARIAYLEVERSGEGTFLTGPAECLGVCD